MIMKYLLICFLLSSCATSPKWTPKPLSGYDRKQWKHWIDHDNNCLNTRQEILKARSMEPVKLNNRGCKVVFGKWNDYYYPQVHHDAKNVEIDHLVPLKHAHESGGANWTSLRKEQFANDPENLVITFRPYNRTKGAKGIDQWLPINFDYACKYINDWLFIKSKYNLSISPKEQHTIATSNCARKK
jgi:hypothetical protein